jgi:hypothetical protein
LFDAKISDTTVCKTCGLAMLSQMQEKLEAADKNASGDDKDKNGGGKDELWEEEYKLAVESGDDKWKASLDRLLPKTEPTQQASQPWKKPKSELQLWTESQKRWVAATRNFEQSVDKAANLARQFQAAKEANAKAMRAMQEAEKEYNQLKAGALASSENASLEPEEQPLFDLEWDKVLVVPAHLVDQPDVKEKMERARAALSELTGLDSFKRGPEQRAKSRKVLDTMQNGQSEQQDDSMSATATSSGSGGAASSSDTAKDEAAEAASRLKSELIEQARADAKLLADGQRAKCG